jgi:hypothetical protein
MTIVLFGWPVRLWYCRQSFSADSTASLPLFVKKTRFRSPGASDAIFAASSIDVGWAYDQFVKKASCAAWSAPACATSARPWPMFVQKRDERPSK